jgi:hypothetical protein
MTPFDLFCYAFALAVGAGLGGACALLAITLVVTILGIGDE